MKRWETGNREHPHYFPQNEGMRYRIDQIDPENGELVIARCDRPLRGSIRLIIKLGTGSREGSPNFDRFDYHSHVRHRDRNLGSIVPDATHGPKTTVVSISTNKPPPRLNDRGFKETSSWPVLTPEEQIDLINRTKDRWSAEGKAKAARDKVNQRDGSSNQNASRSLGGPSGSSASNQLDVAHAHSAFYPRSRQIVALTSGN
ncbi:hypothetical protein T439DRAFT_173946 [Meredithblackwellia eburnea MCA 4105]